MCTRFFESDVRKVPSNETLQVMLKPKLMNVIVSKIVIFRVFGTKTCFPIFDFCVTGIREFRIHAT